MVCKRVVATAEEIFQDVWAASGMLHSCRSDADQQAPAQPISNATFDAAPGAPFQEKAKVELEHEKLD